MDTGLFDVLHDRANDCHLAVTDAINVHFNGVFEKAIDQHRPVRAYLNRICHVALQVLFIIDEFHRASAQNKTRSNENWISYPIGDRDCLVFRHGGSTWGLPKFKLVQHRSKELAILGHLDAFRLCPEDRHTGRL